MLSYLHHQDYENSNINIDKLKEKMTNKEILYDHSKDKKNENKWLTSKKLKNIEINLLPEYLRNNKNIYHEWFD